MNLLDLSSLSLGPVSGQRQPGMSSYLNGRWVHGREALENCRLDPQSTVLDVWENLSLDPVSPSGGMRHRADLAVAQLRELQLDQQVEWCVAVPMEWTKPVVQVFLGVAQECGLKIKGCFPRALVVADRAFPQQDKGLVLEWGWKYLTVGKVTCDQKTWQLSGTERIPDAGVLSVFRRESKMAATWMLDHHRVDPLHSGATEQLLFNSWWRWHSGEKDIWNAEVGAVQSSLSDQLDGLKDLHTSLLEKHGIQNDGAVVAPASFLHISGYTLFKTEEPLHMPGLDRLNLEDTQGPRWRNTLRAGERTSEKKKAVTHVVVNGIAEPAPSGLGAEPGEQVTLQDGREGMAIYVPEC